MKERAKTEQVAVLTAKARKDTIHLKDRLRENTRIHPNAYILHSRRYESYTSSNLHVPSQLFYRTR
jgi:hypothetical protein